MVEAGGVRSSEVIGGDSVMKQIPVIFFAERGRYYNFSSAVEASSNTLFPKQSHNSCFPELY